MKWLNVMKRNIQNNNGIRPKTNGENEHYFRYIFDGSILTFRLSEQPFLLQNIQEPIVHRAEHAFHTLLFCILIIGLFTLGILISIMILPNVSRKSVPTVIKQYNEEQIFSCISTNKNLHETIWATLKRALFTLWNNNSTMFPCKTPSFELNIQLNDVGAYSFSETETNFRILLKMNLF